MYISAVLFFPLILLLLLAMSIAGTATRRRFPSLITEDHSGQFSAVQAAVLALLGLLLGFSFSMGVSRFDTRKNAEIGEATAIGQAFARTGSLPADEAASQQQRMRLYVQQRLEFYDAGTDWPRVTAAAQRAADLEGQMLAEAESRLGSSRDAVSNGYLGALTTMGAAAEQRQAALENRIPMMAWGLLLTVSVAASYLIGLGLRRWHALLLVILPIVVAASLALIWDLDNPRAGLIRVRQNSMHRVESRVMSTPMASAQ